MRYPTIPNVVTVLALCVLATSCVGPFAGPSQPQSALATTPTIPTAALVPATPTIDFSDAFQASTSCANGAYSPTGNARVQAPSFEIIFKTDSIMGLTTVLNQVDDVVCSETPPSPEAVASLLDNLRSSGGVTNLEVRSAGN